MKKLTMLPRRAGREYLHGMMPSEWQTIGISVTVQYIYSGWQIALS